jgi:glutamate carboxypeptidase
MVMRGIAIHQPVCWYIPRHNRFCTNQRNARLIELVGAAGNKLGPKIQDTGSGGTSDANITSILGIPTIDGLSAGGGLARNPGEFIELDYLPIWIALVAVLIRKSGSPPL